MIISQNIDLEQPLTEFENQYNFVSLRSRINQREQEWLSNPNPDFSLCPQIHSVTTFAERCLWNENGEIMVAGKIYKYSDDDSRYITILDGDLEKLALLISGDTSVLSDPMVIVENILPANISTTVTATNTINCASSSQNTVPANHAGGSYRVVSSNRLKKKDWFGGKHSLSAGIITYKWQYPNTYLRFSTILNVEIFGQRYNNCGNTPTTVTGLNKTTVNSALSVELKRQDPISTKYNSSFSSINSLHTASFSNTSPQVFPFSVALRLRY
ncbi:MAG: hypothetical protein WD512_06665 [Candidatus Paceibacterota bacterium]